MSIFQTISVFLLSLTLQMACAQQTDNRNVGDFTEIKVGGAYEVYIKKGTSVAVRLEGPAKELEKIVTEVKEGVLKVHQQKNGKWGSSWNSGKNVKVYITYTALKGLYSSGSSKVKVESEVTTDAFTMGCSGSGDIEVAMKVNSLSARVSGSGDISLSGTCANQTFTISGSGDIDASKLEAKKASLKISGSGSMRVHVTDYLEGRISGSGRVRYKGDPKQSVKISGSGSVRQE